MANWLLSPNLNSSASCNLASGILELGLELNEGKLLQLITYTQLLLKWNKVYSLTTITNTERIIKYHLLDGLTVIPHLAASTSLIDIGSGMGVPGVIIAIWCPELSVTVLDSNQKKAAFLQQVAIELGLTNLTVINQRVEQYKPEAKFDLAISRAFANSHLFLQLAKHLLKPGGTILAMKSQKVQAELAELVEYKCRVIPVTIPGSLDARYLLEIKLS
ncbi:MAG: 16S rRNA (guanine(527)-N(7))-methyltransferase RsmG [Burkholderiales bacterium]